MALLYVEEHEKSLDSEFANGEIYEGDLVVREVGGGVHTVDPTSDDDVDAIVVHLRHGDNIADHDEDFRIGIDSFPYEGDGGVGSDRPSLAIKEKSGVWRPHTISDDTEPAPNIERNTRVGVPAIDGVSGIVEEGYEDSGATVYEESADNFIPLGVAEVDHGYVEDGYDERVSVRLE